MGWKSREEDLAFVGRYRQAKRDHYQKALRERLSGHPRDGSQGFSGELIVPSTRAAAADEPPEPPSLIPAWRRRDQTPTGAIPLGDGERVAGLPGIGAPGPGAPGPPAHAGEESANWLGLELDGVSSLQSAEPAAGSSEGFAHEDDGAPASPLVHLDSVVHDFVAAMDRRTSAPPSDRAGPHAESFRRLLESNTTSTGQILGPPVLFGASPPMGLENILGLLGSMRETGVLHVEAGGVTFTISIVNGDVVHGVSRPRPASELLGNVLVSLGTITAEQLSRFFAEHGSSPSTIGEALDREALVSTEQLGQALEHQLRLLFDRLLATRNAVWCFRAGEATLAYINMRLSVIGVLLESAAKNDERSAG